MITLKQLPAHQRASILEERRQATQAADVFARVCREDNADQLYYAHLFLNECGDDAWRLAMARVAKLSHVTPEIREAFVPIWVESKMLSLRVGSRRVLSDALRVLMAGSYSGPPLTLYRGAGYHERRRRLYGFSWTTDAVIARKFAEHWAQPVPVIEGADPILGVFEGVVLKTLAPRGAILMVRKPGEYYDEGEYDEGEVVVDPFRLGKIEVIERHRSATPRSA
jgi:hypothetical protein